MAILEFLVCIFVPVTTHCEKDTISNEALLGGRGGGVSHPLSLKLPRLLSLIPKITETVIPYP